MSKKAIYFDYAAATPVSDAVNEAMKPYLSDKFYNPSALYLSAKNVKQDIMEARFTVAKIIGTKSSEIIFTAGGTEANNLAIRGIMEQFRNCNLLVSAIEHESVIEPAKQYQHQFIKVNPDGIVDINDLKQKNRSETIVMVRQIFMFLLRKNDRLYYAEIGRMLDKDHSTVMWGVNKSIEYIQVNDYRFMRVYENFKHLNFGK